MAGKRSLEITLKHFDAGHRADAVGRFADAGIEVHEARGRFIQVRNTTPTEVRRLLKGLPLQGIGEGFRS